MSKILVTGAGGFIGSHLTEQLIRQGHNVKAFIHYNSQNRYGWLDYSDLKKEIEFCPGDIRDIDTVSKAVKDVEKVFHLAALISIPYSYVSPLAYIKTNLEGTYNVCEAAYRKGAMVIHTSTSEVYGTAQYIPIDEKHPLNAQSPYAATKIAADQLALSYYRSFNLPVVIARPFNVYGPRQSTRAVIPSIITQLLKGKGLSLGNLAPTRNFNYIADTVRGIIKIGFNEKCIGEIINIGSEEEISIVSLAEMIAKLTNKEFLSCQSKERIRPQNSEVERLCCDGTKMRELTGWKPKYTLEEGLKETISWLKENLYLFKEGFCR
jgi:dTDP-glucose 4,6-dehydratase